MIAGLDELRNLRCRAITVPMGAGPSPAELARSLGGSSHAVALIGDWAGGGAVIATDPILAAAETAGFDAIAAQPHVEPVDGLVGGGWFGWIAFDGSVRLAFYDHLLRWQAGSWSFEALWSDARTECLTQRLAAAAHLLAQPSIGATWQVGRFGGASMPRHLAAVEKAIGWIRAGEIYQANICTRLEADFAGSPSAVFAAATESLQPRFAAFVDGPERSAVCLSPELFLRRRGREIVTSPIKGTAPRTADLTAAALQASTKDAAENVMIVDLMRNDLGRVCEVGTVRASSLLDIEAHPGVWHLVSTVTGRLRADVDDADVLRATFPPGSVTGAPKLRALDAIGELEGARREVYTGAIGFASPCWGTELAVAIRTFEIGQDHIELGVGGGVTSDSVPMLEWRECLHKAAPLLAAIGSGLASDLASDDLIATNEQRCGGLLETILVLDTDPIRLGDHLARLARSMRELYGRALPDGLATRVRSVARDAGPGRNVMRLVARPDGQVMITCAPVGPPPSSSAAFVVRGRAGLWRHKWAERAYFESIEAAGGAGRAPLFVADDGAVLETSRGNVFLLCSDGSIVTPPLREDLLPGITRTAVLDRALDERRGITIRTFGLEEMLQHAAFWTSSISGLVPISSVDEITLPRRDDELHTLAAAILAGR